MESELAAKILFFLFIALLSYTYAGYFLFLKVLAGFSQKKHARNSQFKPFVTILISAYNEEKVIRQKIENCLALDYPGELLEIMVCSDCSDDKTAQIVFEFTGQGIAFHDYRERSGKTGVINKSVSKARGEIIVLTDANTMLAADAVSKMMSLYSSEEIGAVLGQVKLTIPSKGKGIEKELTYRDMESELKYIEGLFGMTIGAFGGFYSIRKSLFFSLPINAYSDDFLIPMGILQRGHKVIFDWEAISTENTERSVKEEFKRRIRIGAGNFQSFFLLPAMLNPMKGFPFFFYFSHKVLRWFSPFALIIIFITNIFLWPAFVFKIIFLLQLLFYLSAMIGALLAKMHITVTGISPIHHFVSMNLALLLGFFRYARGIKNAAWQSTERVVE